MARALVLGCLAVVTLVAGSVPVPVNAMMARPVRHSYALASGVRLTTIREPDMPNQVRILRVDQGTGPRLEVLTASAQYPGYVQPSSLGAAAGSIAAVNGDFVARDGRPKHLSMVNGEVWTSGIQSGPVFAVSKDGDRAYMGIPHLEIAAQAGTASFPIATWNAGDPHAFRVAGFTKRGGSVERPSGDPSPSAADPRYCAARLLPSGNAGSATVRTYTVNAQPEPCPKTPISLGSDPDAVAITGLNDLAGGKTVKRLDVGDAVSISTRLRGWPGVVDVMGGSPLLVKAGRNVAPGYHSGDNYVFNYNPRTAVGLGKGCLDTDDATHCVTFVVTVDGRQSDTWSKGMRMPRLASVLIHAGARWAMNLDGGGGTVMWVSRTRRAYCESHPPAGGCLVTRPSESGRERGTSVSLAVRPPP
jgi:hypothetical protein